MNHCRQIILPVYWADYHLQKMFYYTAWKQQKEKFFEVKKQSGKQGE